MSREFYKITFMEITADAKKRLAALIEERDAPLAPLAAKIGVSQSTLWNFIYGETKNFSKIHLLATELKVSLDWIIGGDVAPPAGKAERALMQVSESARDGFAGPDKIFLREIAVAVAALARDYPKLGNEAIGAIALALWADLKTGKLAGVKKIAAEARR
ncbi:MAG: helix-turn-helix transcriptional regulator, partial [Alphaproteobacteria bacterium]|nr:helix-turn-helix transcriptional regulator [Alphaproteobacteria bacterium]